MNMMWIYVSVIVALKCNDALAEIPVRPYRVTAISVGGVNGGCALLENARIKCWGRSGYGDREIRGDEPDEMGNRLKFINLGKGRLVKAVEASSAHTCAILDNEKLKCWGISTRARLGSGGSQDFGFSRKFMGDNIPYVKLGVGRTVLQVSSGFPSGPLTCVILDTGSVKCWGKSLFDFAKLGTTPLQVSLGTGRTAMEIKVGGTHVCAILDNSQLKCWGSKLGAGDRINRDYRNRTIMGDNLPFVDLGSDRRAMHVATSRSSTCVILDTAQIKCWGSNQYGILGLGDTKNRGVDPYEMGDNLPVVELATGRFAIAIEAGSYHMCAILDNGRIKCWGRNHLGQLGLGDTVARGDDPNEMGDNLPYVNLGTNKKSVSISCTDFGCCSILDDGQVKCWGKYSGPTYYGHFGSVQGDMGNDLPTLPLGTVRVTDPQLISCTDYTKMASCAKALTSSNNVSCMWARGVCIETPTCTGANDGLRGNYLARFCRRSGCVFASGICSDVPTTCAGVNDLYPNPGKDKKKTCLSVSAERCDTVRGVCKAIECTHYSGRQQKCAAAKGCVFASRVCSDMPTTCAGVNDLYPNPGQDKKKTCVSVIAERCDTVGGVCKAIECTHYSGRQQKCAAAKGCVFASRVCSDMPTTCAGVNDLYPNPGQDKKKTCVSVSAERCDTVGGVCVIV